MVNNVSKPLVPNSSEKNQTVLSGPILKESKEEKFISALKQDVPVIQTTLIPSSYSPDYSPAPLVIKDAMYGNTPCVRINGSVIIEAVSAPDCSGSLVPLRRGFLNPGVSNLGPIMLQMSNQYQKHLWLNTALFYTPQCPTSVKGAVILTWQNSPNVTYTPTTSLTELSQRSSFVLGHVHKGLTLPLKGDHKQLYNWFGTTASDLKFYSDWSYEWWTVGSCNNDGVLGYVGMTFDLLLFSRIENKLIGLDVMPKQTLSLLHYSSGYSIDTCASLLSKIQDYFEPNDEDKDDERRFITQSKITKQLNIYNKMIKSGKLELAGLDEVILQGLGWDKSKFTHPIRAFVSNFIRLMEIRSYDFTLLSRYNVDFNFISTFIEYVLTNQEVPMDIPELEFTL
jgi:hypothetical protein